MAVDAFIWFKEQAGMLAPKGETLDAMYTTGGGGLNGDPNPAFEIKDFSFGVENPTTIGSATGGAGAGKCKFNEFTIKKTTDSASPAFFRNCAAGAHYKKVTLEMRKSGGDAKGAGKPFLTYFFDTVFTTKIDWSGPGDEGPEESITFVYGKLVVKYWPQKASGEQDSGAANQLLRGWNQITNRADDSPP